ncbi:MAG TPA: hypothetical protein PKA82_10650, partial [Pyrinomonadaceae bacterium]|nr:hypothetical protein [Pyrinomonadaceae bacterium]
MTKGSKLWVAFPTAIVAGIVNIFLFFLFMVLYGHVINPGHDDAFYQDAASRFGPYASIIGGIPVFFTAGWLLRRFLSERALKVAIATWVIYVAVDFAIIVAVAADQIVAFLPLLATSFGTKLAAIYFGARMPAQTTKEN